MVVITGAEVTPSSLAGAGGDGQCGLGFGGRSDELEKSPCGDRIDFIVEKQEASSSARGAVATGVGDFESFGGDGFEFFSRNGRSIDGLEMID